MESDHRAEEADKPPPGMWLTALSAHQLSSKLDGRLSGSAALLRSAWLDSRRKQWNLLVPLIFLRYWWPSH